MTSDSIKPLPDAVLDGLMHLPLAPARPVTGPGFQRAKFPALRTLNLKRVWCAIPSAHKDEGLHCISPEAFNVVSQYLDGFIDWTTK